MDMDVIWRRVLVAADHTPLLRSPFLFLLIASITGAVVGTVFSVVDLATGRVPATLLARNAARILLGIVPFWVLGVSVDMVAVKLPATAPTLREFTTQWIAAMLVSDVLHYWTHRAMHRVRFWKHHVHAVHHAHDGPLFSWLAIKVHPAEAVVLAVVLYAPFVLFTHPLVTWTHAVVASLHTFVAHSGYDLFGFGGFSTPRDHQLHHDVNATHNFGNVLTLWDRLFGTYAASAVARRHTHKVAAA